MAGQRSAGDASSSCSAGTRTVRLLHAARALPVLGGVLTHSALPGDDDDDDEQARGDARLSPEEQLARAARAEAARAQIRLKKRRDKQYQGDPYDGLSDEEAALARMRDLDELLGTVGLDEPINNFGWTQLIYNARTGDLNNVRLLLLAGADTGSRDSEGSVALHFAAGQGHVDVVKELLAAGADPLICCDDGRSALHRAAGNGKVATLQLLLEPCASILDARGGPLRRTAAEEAARWQHADCVDALAAAGAAAPPLDLQ